MIGSDVRYRSKVDIPLTQGQVTVNGKQRYLGLFLDPIEAAKAYDRAALEAFGEFAVPNFPAAARSL